MSLLKRFGAMVSSLRPKAKRKKTNKKEGRKKRELFFWRTKKKSRLRTTLFVQPLGIVALSFIVILVLFNLTLSWFIDGQAENAVQNQYDILDALYVGETPNENSEGNIFQTTYIIVDEDFNIQYVSASMDDVSENALSEEITDYIYDHERYWDFFDDDDDDDDDDENTETTPRNIELNGSSYILEMERYTGILNNYYVRQDTESEEFQTYYVFVFADITAVSYLDLWLNVFLLTLLIIIGIVASFIIYLTSRKLDRSFGRLKDYIIQVGNREADRQPEDLSYHEFNEVGATVARMNEMIDASQRSQQIFFQNSSHELRTPLMSIQGYAEGIKEGIVKDDKEAAQVIYDESQRMTDLVDDILTLSRVENVQNQLQLEIIAINDLLYDMSWRFKNKADEKGIRFEHQFEDDYLELEADEKMLERAIGNLLSNAVRYAKKSIVLSCQKQADFLTITIANDGPEISGKDRDHLFERFYKGEGGNFGIGLAMTKEIVERHAGEITVRSEQNWTSFIIRLPIKQNIEETTD